MLTVNINLRAHLSAAGVEEMLRRVLAHLADSAKYIAYRMGESNRKLTGTFNASGEEQLELDVYSDRILLQRLQQETSFGVMDYASEERDRVHELHTHNGEYSIAVDPLDGSSLVDVNLSIGTIAAIHKGPILGGRPGRDSMVAAMYVLYGPLTTLVYCAGKGVHEFVMDPTGNFVLANENIRMKDKGSIYAPGGLNKEWLPEHAQFIADLERQGYKLRYSGGLVPDINQILMKGGGVFCYPKLAAAPQGKLRLLFELQALSYVIEHAGGAATDGAQPILDIVPRQLEQRSPIYIGSRHEVQLAQQYLQNGRLAKSGA